MTTVLNKEDFNIILQYYDINTSNLLPNELQEKASHILTNKLCKCVNNINCYKTKKYKRKVKWNH